jgi:hypothetical protein
MSVHSAIETGLRVPGVVNVLVKRAVKAGTESQGFDSKGPRLKLIGISEMNERVRDYANVSASLKRAKYTYVPKSNH